MPSTNYALNASLNRDFGGISSASPVTYYLGLSTITLTASDTSGSVASEPATSGSYARYPLPNDKSTWTTSVSGSLNNVISGSFNTATASWGTIYSVFLSDSQTRNAGNIWYYYPLSPGIVVQSGGNIWFDEGDIVVTRT